MRLGGKLGNSWRRAGNRRKVHIEHRAGNRRHVVLLEFDFVEHTREDFWPHLD